MRWTLSLALLLSIVSARNVRKDVTPTTSPVVVDSSKSLTFNGVYDSSVEAFLGIRYGQDTGGQNRFKPSKTYNYTTGTVVNATTTGPACPQDTGGEFSPIFPLNITHISEDCLLLNVHRPNGTTSHSKLPVMLYIHGGGLIESSKDELVTQPGGLILQSILNGLPIMHVSINYRLGAFGFARSAALLSEGSTNAGLRDQRLAIEWVKDNIEAFGGDPNKITIFGQSSGGLSVGMQIMAHGATKPVPFQQAICESQSLEGGITGNFTIKAMARLVNATGCNSTAFDSADTVACLRSLTTQQFLDAQIETHLETPAANIGDEWLPVVDGDFLPDVPSRLIDSGRFANITTMIGWCNGDANLFPPTTITTASDSEQFFRDYLPGMNDTSIATLKALYPVSDFGADPAANLSAEFFRSARVMRDIVFTCNGIYYGQAISAKGSNVYLFDQNQTFIEPILAAEGYPGIGVVHSSEFAYVFANFTHYQYEGLPFQPNTSDYALLTRESRSWSTFAATGHPSAGGGKITLEGWTPAYMRPGSVDIFVIGGPQEGLFAETGSANIALNVQQLDKRCAFLNSPDIIKQLNY